MLKEFFEVSNYPYLGQEDAFANKLIRIAKVYGLIFLGLILVSPLLALADKFVIQVLHHKSLLEINQHTFQQLYKKVGRPTAMFYICLLGPMCEEVLFRLGLSFKKKQVVVSACFAFFYISMAFLRTQTKQPLLYTGIAIGFLIIVMILSHYLIFDTTLNLSAEAKRCWVILSITLFGLMHVFNFRPMDWSLIWIYPIFVIPQLLMGWGITYVRFKNGFWWGVGLHCFINTMATLLTLIVKK